MQVGDTLLNGQVIILTVDTRGYVLAFELPSVRDPNTGEAQRVGLDYGILGTQVEALAAIFLSQVP